MRNGNERKSSLSSSPLDCDVGLGLKMQLQPTESYSCDGSGGGGPFFGNTSNQVECAGGIYEAADRSFQNTAFRASGGVMPVSGKALFTASQWQELERQKMIHKYIMASIPVPPELLLPTSRSPALTSVSQCNTPGMDLRFSSSGSDPEPWRCKRTDGKKWRCSRDVAPDQKYCERHAHKSRPRSRKHVEVSSHNTSNNYSQQALILPANSPTTNTLQPLQRSSSQFPTMASATSYDQTRCIEWFMRGGGGGSSSSGGTIPVSTCKQQQWQQVMQRSSSSRLELDRDNTDHNKNVSAYQPHYEDKQGFMSLNPYIPDATSLQRLENHHQLSNGQSCNSILDSKMASLQGGLSLNADRTQTTRHFIDAWEKEGFDGISSKDLSASLTKKFSPSSLTLSMSGGNGIGEDNENGHLGIGMINSDRDSDGILKPQWLNPVSWMNSPPGGPLGEALCLGNASTTRGSSNLASPHGYSNSNTNSSSCSKSSCEDGSHALNFIG
ncbi:hypothetical protein Pfo_009972 [Paulownia fortunei]|nr:hypothetical protein Pfo_009972 [Paulownia fortunei]